MAPLAGKAPRSFQVQFLVDSTLVTSTELADGFGPRVALDSIAGIIHPFRSGSPVHRLRDDSTIAFATTQIYRVFHTQVRPSQDLFSIPRKIARLKAQTG